MIDLRTGENKPVSRITALCWAVAVPALGLGAIYGLTVFYNGAKEAYGEGPALVGVICTLVGVAVYVVVRSENFADDDL